MLTNFEKKEIKYFDDRNSGKIFSNLSFYNVHFIGSSIDYYKLPLKSINIFNLLKYQKSRTTFRNIRITECEQTGCSVHGIVAENIIITDLKTHNVFHSWSSVFKNIMFLGKIGSIMISPLLYLTPNKIQKEIQAIFDKANTEYYSNIDWALDIQEALFSIPIDIRGIPARLIRRDIDTQAVIKLEKAMKIDWKKIDLSDSPWLSSIKNLIIFRLEDKVLTVPKNAPKKRKERYLDGIKKLRDYGIAELD